MARKRGHQPSALQFYWYEIKPNEVMQAAWGQFVGAIHRMIDIDDELSDALRQREIRKRMHRMTRIIEGYLHRAYELRERMVNLLALVSGDAAAAGASKNPQKRAKALSKIRGSHAPLVDGASRLLSLLDDDMLLRNMHTHEQFLSLGLVAYNGPYDPDDVLTDLEHRPDDYRAMSSLLRRETRRLADEYRARIRNVRDAALAVAETSDIARSPKA